MRRRRKESKERQPWLNASGISKDGKLRRFSIDRVGDNYHITGFDPLSVWPPEPDRRATEENVRRELEEEFRLENVKIEPVKFKVLPSGLKIIAKDEA
jgi:hypothetical protein